jgi:hypothetical protein
MSSYMRGAEIALSGPSPFSLRTFAKQARHTHKKTFG